MTFPNFEPSQFEFEKPSFREPGALDESLIADSQNLSRQPGINNLAKEDYPESRKLLHEISQPLTYLLTGLEMGTMGEGLSIEECQIMLNAALNIRALLDKLRLVGVKKD